MSLSSLVPSAHPTAPGRVRRRIAGVAMVLAVASGALLAGGHSVARAASPPATTAWRHGSFALDPDGVVSRDDIVLGRPNVTPTGSIPLGNGTLGVAAWAANGFTAQLNRSDTMPDRKSPGQVSIPGLSVITHAADFKGRLDLTDGVLEESGGGMSMKAWVSSAKDEMIVDVTGADPGVAQTASLYLWPGRNPAAAVNGEVGTLAETWVDNSEAGSGGQTFGSLAAITAGGRSVETKVAGPVRITTTFKPNADGSFRVVVAAPHWAGGTAKQTASKLATSLIGSDARAHESALLGRQDRWWKNFWTQSGLVQMSSADGSAAYIENLRTLYLYEEAASEKEGTYPGNQAGDADMFDWSQDKQTWTPSEYWLWNMRAEISANMSSGNYQLNLPIFDMYIEDLPAIEAWTKSQMGGLPGACVPEVMRFNGNGGSKAAGQNSACSEPGSPNWNALDITSGPELSVYMWEQYQATGDLAFLRKAFPFMEATAQFLLAYQQVGSDGLLHAVANAHETQWAVQDPTTDIAADQALFPIIAQAAKLVGVRESTDPLLGRFATAENEIPPYPRTDDATRTHLLNPDYTAAETSAADATGTDMIAISYQPAASRQNGENIELEPLWPWDQVSDQDANLWALEQRSYTNRPNKGGNDWSFDAVDAARLQLPSQVESNLVSLTESHQVYPNGFADIGSSVGYQPYMEQSAGVAAAVDEALAQDYDGIIRFAPAWPSDWDASGTVYIQHGDKVDVQVENGQLVTAAIEAGTSGRLTVKSPWPGQKVQAVSGTGSNKVIAETSTTDTFSFDAQAGKSYLVERTASPVTALRFAPVTGTPATADRHLGGKVQIGLDPSGPAATAVIGTVLGSSNSDDGLTQVDVSSAGQSAQTTTGDVDGLMARTTTGTPVQNDMYFTVDPAVAATSSYDATVKVSYYDGRAGTIALQYDDGPGDAYHAAGTITLTGSDSWKTATFTISGAWFGADESADTDFRLSADEPITVHSVGMSVTGPAVPAVTEFPAAPTITTPAANQTVPLSTSIAGTSDPDAQVTVSEGSTTLCTATASDAGSFNCAPSGGLPQGRRTITATETDPTGYTGPASPGVAFTASDAPPGTALIGAVAGSTDHSYGLSENNSAYDGPTTESDIDGLSALTSTDSNIYFSVDDSVADAGYYSASFTVQYYDAGTGSFQVQYDNGTSNPYEVATPNIPLTNSGTWKTATVTADDAYFGDEQNGGADFRLRNGGGQVTVHSVAVTIKGSGVADVTDFPPAVAIASPAPGSTVSTKPTVSGTSEPDASITVDSGGTAICTATAADDGSWSCTPATPLADGSTTLTATASEAVAGPVTSSPVPVTVSG